MLEHTPPSMNALAGIELALEHVNLEKPLTKQALLNLQSDCLDAPLPFRIHIKTWIARKSICLKAVRIHDDKDEDKWNWGSSPLCQIEFCQSGIDTIECARLRDHSDSIEGARIIQLAVAVLLRKASHIADRFGECFEYYKEEKITDH